MVWIPIEDSFPDNKKTVQLRSLLKLDTAEAYLLRLWLWAARNRPDGKLLSGDAELGARWKGKPGRLEAFLRESRWMDPDGTLHDWMDWAGSDLQRMAKERDGNRKRQAKLKQKKALANTLGNGEGNALPNVDGNAPVTLPRAREIETEKKTEKKINPPTPLTGGDAVDRIFEHYRRAFRKGAVYTLTARRRQKIALRLAELGEPAVLVAVSKAAGDNWFRTQCTHNGIEDLLKSRDSAETWATKGGAVDAHEDYPLMGEDIDAKEGNPDE